MPRLSIRRLLRRLAGDERGVSAVEFALIAPVMILFYAGLVDLCQGYMALKRTSHVAATVADLASQSTALTATDVDNIFDAGPDIMAPFNSTALEQRISSVTRVSSSTYKVDWSRSSKSTGALSGDLTVAGAKVPADLLADGESVIIAEAAYTYASPFQQFLPEFRFERRALLEPRRTAVITCSTC
ncbi:TadE/TadG family type IV pilus assembly protein [Brevundimonas sp. SL130]|uniref:TadE/TadG family type IV pilus assembly protein n=1 Tax=Brevundimonas sp. SL130 TaxID=2995143 RepID=UPI00226CF083|nr:TadE/TadG family type IV pilus assembly protein [Brevundimonas sp. SL130]WAC60481.1 pilus assembly protein [Brevundimonas sp. SL130]